MTLFLVFVGVIVTAIVGSLINLFFEGVFETKPWKPASYLAVALAIAAIYVLVQIIAADDSVGNTQTPTREDTASSMVVLYYQHVQDGLFDKAATLLDPSLLIALGGREAWQIWMEQRTFRLPDHLQTISNGDIFRVWANGLVITPNGQVSEPPAFYTYCLTYKSLPEEWIIMELHDEKTECW